jgi:flagellar assembly protein FliH
MSVAREEGFRKARAEVDAAIARHDAAERGLQSVTRALLQAIDQLQAHDGESMERVQHQAVMFGAALAEELIGRELRMSDDLVTATVDRAVAFTPDRGAIILRVHPIDLAIAREHAEGIDQIVGRVDLVGDPTVERGGCVATVGPLRIDAQVGVALERVRAVLAS